MPLVPPMPSLRMASPAPGVRCRSAVAASAASSSLRRRRSAVLSRASTTPSAALLPAIASSRHDIAHAEAAEAGSTHGRGRCARIRAARG